MPNPNSKSAGARLVMDNLTEIGSTGKKTFLKYETSANGGEERKKREADREARIESVCLAIKKKKAGDTAALILKQGFREEVDLVFKTLDKQQEGVDGTSSRAKRKAAALARSADGADADVPLTEEQIYGEAPNLLLAMTGAGALLSPYMREVLRAPVMERGSNYKDYHDSLIARSSMAEVTLAKLDEKRKLWVRRFDVVGSFFWTKLRFCKWKMSLRAGFEAMPSTVGGGNVDAGYMVPLERFKSVLANSISLDLQFITYNELALWGNEVFALFDVELTGYIDYREFSAISAFFRLETHATFPQMLIALYRAFEGDMSHGLSTRDLLRTLTFFAINPVEVQGILELCNWEALIEDKTAPKIKYVVNVLGELVKEGLSAREVSAKASADADEAATRAASEPVKILSYRRETEAKGEELLAGLQLLNDDAHAHHHFNKEAKSRNVSHRMLFVMRRGENKETIEARWLRERKEADLALEEAAIEEEERMHAEARDAAELKVLAMLSAADGGPPVKESHAPLTAKTYADRKPDGSGFLVMRMRAVGGSITQQYLDESVGAVINLSSGLYRYQRIMKPIAEDDPSAPWNRGFDTMASSRYFGVVPNDKARTILRTNKGTAFLPIGPRTQLLNKGMLKLSSGAAFNLSGPWERYMKSKTGKSHVPAGLPVIPVPSIIEKFGLPNPVDVMLHNELSEGSQAALDAQRRIEEQVKSLENLIDDEPDDTPDGDNGGEAGNFGWAADGGRGAATGEARGAAAMLVANAAATEGHVALAKQGGDAAGQVDKLVTEAKLANPSSAALRLRRLFEKPTPFDALAPWPLPKHFTAPRPPVAPAAAIGPYNYFPANSSRPARRWTLASVPGFSEGLPFPVTAKACNVTPAAALRVRLAARESFLSRGRLPTMMAVVVKQPKAKSPTAEAEAEAGGKSPTGVDFGVAFGGAAAVSAIEMRPVASAELLMLGRASDNVLMPLFTELSQVDESLADVLAMGARCKIADPYRKEKEGQAIGGTTVIVSIPASFERADIKLIRRFVAACPGLSIEMMRLRILRMVPDQRTLFLQEEIRNQVRRSAAVRESLNNETSEVLALEAFRLRTEAMYFQAWVGAARELIWERVRINSMRARRALRSLVIYSREKRIMTARRVRAENFYAFTFFRRNFLAWRSSSSLLRQEAQSGHARACALNRVHVLARVYSSWHSITVNKRAILYYSAIISKKAFHNWAVFTARARARRVTNRVIDNISLGRLDLVSTITNEWTTKRSAELASEAYRAELESFNEGIGKSLALEAEGKELARVEAVLLNSQKREAQQAASNSRAKAARAILEADFKRTWDAKIDHDMMLAYTEHGLWLDSGTAEAEGALAVGLNNLRAARTVEEASAQGSAFAAEEQVDGAIHFICSLDARVVSKKYPWGRPALDFNRNTMTDEEGRYVAREHSLSITAINMKAELINKMVEAAEVLAGELAATKLQLAFRSRGAWQKFCAKILDDTEVFCDTLGAIYYMHVPTGRTSVRPWLFLRKRALIVSLPEWFCRLDNDSPSECEVNEARDGPRARAKRARVASLPAYPPPPPSRTPLPASLFKSRRRTHHIISIPTTSFPPLLHL